MCLVCGMRSHLRPGHGCRALPGGLLAGFRCRQGCNRYAIAIKVQKKSKEIDQCPVGSFSIGPVVACLAMVEPVVAVADSLQALRNGTTDDQWDVLKANPLVKDLLRKCSDLEAALLVGESVPQQPPSSSRIALKSVVDAHLLLAA